MSGEGRDPVEGIVESVDGSRRSMLKRLLLGGALLALPVSSSIALAQTGTLPPSPRKKASKRKAIRKKATKKKAVRKKTKSTKKKRAARKKATKKKRKAFRKKATKKKKVLRKVASRKASEGAAGRIIGRKA
jgi:hypothetical protein